MKHFIKRSVILMLCAVMLLSMLPAVEAHAAGNEAGYCGDNLTWRISNGTLTISGTGKMYTYYGSVYDSLWYTSSVPWYNVTGNPIHTVVVEDGVTSISPWAFHKLHAVTSITIADSVTSIGKYAFFDCPSLTEVKLPKNITALSEGAFSGCTSLTGVEIPANVTSIGSAAFSGCTGLTEIELPANVTEIGQEAFKKCTSLTEIVIPDGVTDIEASTFSDCDALSKLTLPKNLTTIGELAFVSCDSLTSVTFPASLTEIKAFAFSTCSKLTDLNFEGDAPTIAATAFRNLNATAGYPADNKTWTSDVMKDYGGTISWWAAGNKPATPVLTVTSDSTSGKPKLTWGKIDGAVKYQIYRKIGKDGTYKKLATVTGTSHIDETAEVGTKYYYRLRAVTGDGLKSAYCSGKARTCDLPRPVVDEANDPASGSVTLAWDKIEGAEEYKIYRRVGKDGSYKYYKSTTDNTYTDSNTTPGTVYYYKVKAIHANSSANSAKSSGVGQTCNLPRPVVTEFNASTTGKIMLKWNEIEGAEQYTIYRATSKGGLYMKIKTTTETAYTDNTTTAGDVFYYKVIAVHSNTSANSARSTVVYQTCDLPCPIVIESSIPETGKIKLEWNSIVGAKEYNIYRKAGKSGSYVLLNTTGDTSYIDNDTIPGTIYYYKVKAIHSKTAANSAYSPTVYQTCDLAQPKLTVSLNESGVPLLTWDAIDGTKQYKVYCSEDGEYWNLLEATTDNTLTHSAAAAGKTYYYKVKAIHSNSSANSTYSSVESIKVQ